MKKPLVSVIIPTYKRKEKLIRCLESVFKNTYKNIEVIVINDSPNEDISDILQIFPSINLIQNKKELLLAGCRNLGAENAKGSILFFVDDDNILDKHSIKILIDAYLKLQNVGLIGPIMYSKDGKLWFYGSKANWINPNPKPLNKKILLNKKYIETDVIPNAYMVSKRLFFKLGKEDDKYLCFYHGELDLAQKAKKKGYKNYIIKAAKVVHDYGSIKQHISSKRLYYMVKSNIIIEKRYAPKYRYVLFWLLFMPIHFVFYTLYYIPFNTKNRIEYYKAYFNGLVDGLAYKKEIDLVK
jgi:GT2 family glycosyltransferase